MIQALIDHSPKIHPGAFVHDMACLIGQVIVKQGASIWPGVVLRGDMGLISIGENSSIQDGSIGHMSLAYSSLSVGHNVTVGHGVILHGCIIENNSLIGMGSIILDKAIIGAGSLVAAGSLITANKEFEPGSFIQGSPAKRLRAINDRERAMIKSSVEHYLEVVKKYRSPA